AFARAREVPDETEARLGVREKLVQLDIGRVEALGLLEVPAQAKVELQGPGDLKVILNVTALDISVDGVASRVETEVTHSNATEDQERVSDCRQIDWGDSDPRDAAHRAGANQRIRAIGGRLVRADDVGAAGLADHEVVG